MTWIDRAEKKVIGFLAAKGLLYDPQAVPMPTAKLSAKEVLAVAENIEPRVYEVLPAAILHFPRSFVRLESFPKDILEVVEALKKGVADYDDVRGMRYKGIKRWADRSLPDKRTRPASEKKVMRAFRLRPVILAKLAKLARGSGLTETETVERLIESAETAG